MQLSLCLIALVSFFALVARKLTTRLKAVMLPRGFLMLSSSCLPASSDLTLHFFWDCHIDCNEPSLPGFHQWPGTGRSESALYHLDTKASLHLATQKLKAWAMSTPVPAAESHSDREEMGPLLLSSLNHTAQASLRGHEVNQATVSTVLFRK